MYQSQRLALKYFTAAIVIFGVMVIGGLIAATDFVQPRFLYPELPFNIAKILHIDGLIVWLLMGFIGAVYWFLPGELGRETEGVRLGEIMFWILCAAVAVVFAVFILVQYGSSDQFAMWFINQGRKYVEAPRWAAIGVVLVLLVFSYNIVIFWGVFWPGILVAILALWAALYRPGSAAGAQAESITGT